MKSVTWFKVKRRKYKLIYYWTFEFLGRQNFSIEFEKFFYSLFSSSSRIFMIVYEFFILIFCGNWFSLGMKNCKRFHEPCNDSHELLFTSFKLILITELLINVIETWLNFTFYFYSFASSSNVNVDNDEL